MTLGELLVDSFERIRDGVHAAVEGLSPDELAHRPSPRANSIAWLVWHLTRIQDDHIAEVADLEQVWTAQGFHADFGLPFAPEEHGRPKSDQEIGRAQV